MLAAFLHITTPPLSSPAAEPKASAPACGRRVCCSDSLYLVLSLLLAGSLKLRASSTQLASLLTGTPIDDLFLSHGISCTLTRR